MIVLFAIIAGLLFVSHGVTLLGGLFVGALAALAKPDPPCGPFGRPPTSDPGERWARNNAEAKAGR